MKVLFVVTAFYPEQAIGSIRISKFAKYFHKEGVEISVISLTPPPWSSRDESLYFDALKDINWQVVDQSSIFKKVFQRMRVATIGTVPGNAGVSKMKSKITIKTKIRNLLQFFYTLLKGIDWSIRVKKHALKNLKNENFDFIFCSYPSFASPLGGIKLKKMGIGNKLIVDFRDPILSQKTSKFNLKYLLQKYIIKNSDLMTFISAGVQNQVDNKIVNTKNLIAPNGFDPQDIKNIKLDNNKNKDKKILRFVYTGAIYGGKRDLRPFFAAISEIEPSLKDAKQKIRFEYAGREGDLFLSQATEYNLQSYVVDHGQLSRLDALRLQQESDICLLATWNTTFEQGALTGKIFEYFMFKKPILAIVVGNLPNSEICKIINRIDAGHCFEEAAIDSKKNLVAWIQNVIDEKQKNGTIESKYNHEVKSFDIREVVKVILTKMNELNKNRAL
tara:strand:+ start:309 stop:1643 length:1335 start_codon:yes stop_codon:yes gene_type:complete